MAKRSRNCSSEKDFDPLSHQSKQICIDIDPQAYETLLLDPGAFRACLDQEIAVHPELFPTAIQHGYKLYDMLPESKKLPGIRLRRIELQAGGVFTIRPAFVLPYMTGYTEDVEKALFLRRWGVPFWALVYVFGHDVAYWYRLEQRLGHNSIVGTTVKDPATLPVDLLADEKHTHFNGHKAYIATTVGQECVLGVSLTLAADEPTLTAAYGHFKTEAQNVQPEYTPNTVNTDGWAATQAAWRALFTPVRLILCFLHAFLKIRDCCKRFTDLYGELQTRVWDAYRAPDAEAFTAQLAQLQAWATERLPAGRGLEAVLKLCAKAPEFGQAYAHPTAYRTSNMVDRHMQPLDHYLDSCKYFHGHLLSGEYTCRAWALCHNFQPYCPRAKIAQTYTSPAHRLNGFVYHDNWLHNLLISASLGGYRQ